MSEPTCLRFESKLSASRERVWDWITSVEGISREMWPILKMTVPRRVHHLTDADVRPGVALFRSYILLFGCLPIDRSDLTLIEIDRGRGFVEESPMLSMRLWRHERRIIEPPYDRSFVLLVDTLSFQPRWAGFLVRWFVQRFFTHRHAVLCAHFDGVPTPATNQVGSDHGQRKFG